jgi:hypothetical protein
MEILTGVITRYVNTVKRKKKVLFDFADIESFDPDGNSFLQLRANDGCFYDRNKDGRRNANWCDEWIARHPDNGVVLPIVPHIPAP